MIRRRFLPSMTCGDDVKHVPCAHRGCGVQATASTCQRRSPRTRSTPSTCGVPGTSSWRPSCKVQGMSLPGMLCIPRVLHEALCADVLHRLTYMWRLRPLFGFARARPGKAQNGGVRANQAP